MRSWLAGRIQPILATPLIEDVFHGSRGGAIAKDNGARGDAFAGRAVALELD